MLGQVLRALSSTQHVLLPGPFLVAPSQAVQVTHHNHVGICSGLPSRGAETPGDSVEKARLRRKGEGLRRLCLWPGVEGQG